MELNSKKQIDYLLKITDKIGIIEHCKGHQPDYVEGWCVDDNARALQICLRYKDSRLKKIKSIYFSFLESALRNNNFYDDLNQDLTWKEGFESGGEHCGRTLVVLGEIIKFDIVFRDRAIKLFDQIYEFVKNNKNFWTRVMAHTILGLQYYRSEEIGFWVEKIIEKYNLEKENEWLWFDREMTYDNGRLPMALLVAYQKTENKKYLEVALESLDFLTEVTFEKEMECFSFPGNRGWFTKSGNRAKFDQQPIEAGTMVEAYVLAYKITKNEKYKKLAKLAMDWYFGNNISKISMIDKKTGGIYDGLEEKKVNQNQGAESVLSYLLAAKEIEKLNLI